MHLRGVHRGPAGIGPGGGLLPLAQGGRPHGGVGHPLPPQDGAAGQGRAGGEAGPAGDADRLPLHAGGSHARAQPHQAPAHCPALFLLCPQQASSQGLRAEIRGVATRTAAALHATGGIRGRADRGAWSQPACGAPQVPVHQGPEQGLLRLCAGARGRRPQLASLPRSGPAWAPLSCLASA